MEGLVWLLPWLVGELTQWAIRNEREWW